MDNLMKLAWIATDKTGASFDCSEVWLAEFARLIRADMQERCAKVCEQVGFDAHGAGRDDSESFDCADAIRAMED